MTVPPRRAGINSGRRLQPRTPPNMPPTMCPPRPGQVADPSDRDSGPADEFVGSKFQRTPDNRPTGILVPHWAIQIARNKSELLVLAQLAYWFGQTDEGKLRCKLNEAGHFWVYKTFSKLARDIGAGITKDQVRGAVRSLRDRGIVVGRQDAERGVLYRLSRTEIRAAVESAEQGEDDGDAY